MGFREGFEFTAWALGCRVRGLGGGGRVQRPGLLVSSLGSAAWYHPPESKATIESVARSGYHAKV